MRVPGIVSLGNLEGDLPPNTNKVQKRKSNDKANEALNIWSRHKGINEVNIFQMEWAAVLQ